MFWEVDGGVHANLQEGCKPRNGKKWQAFNILRVVNYSPAHGNNKSIIYIMCLNLNILYSVGKKSYS